MSYVVTTVYDLLRLALQTAGAIGQNENPSADEAQDAIMILNDMMDSWSIQKSFVYTVQRTVFTIPSLKQIYTLGPGGDFNAPRPVRIEEVYVQLIGSGDTTELPVDVVDYDQWAEITVKGTASEITRTMWPDYQYPMINCSMWPVPNATQNFVFYMWQLLSQFTTINQTISLPQGYRRAIRYNLAVELFMSYGEDVPPSIQKIADDSMAEVKRVNRKILLMGCDAALLTKSRTFNYLTGETS